MRPQRYPVDAFVPDGYRFRRLPDPVREWIDRKTGQLAAAFDRTQTDSTAEGDDYNAEQAQILDDTQINWWIEGSERTVVGVGRTFRGDLLFDDRRGVVIKFNPWLRADTGRDRATTPAVAGNLHALCLSRFAVDRGDNRYFAPIYDYDEQGAWIAMEHTIPIFRLGGTRLAANRNYITDPGGQETGPGYIDALLEEMQPQGWDPHTKDGNIGLTDGGDAVVIDLGAHISHDSLADARDLIPNPT